MTKSSPDTERWKELDAASYDGVAEAFDRHSQRLSGRAAIRLAELVRIGRHDRVLDVGTGTGLLPFSLVRVAEPPASVLVQLQSTRNTGTVWFDDVTFG